MTARLVVLASGTGTLLRALLDAQADPSYPAEVVAVVSDRPDARALARGTGHGVPAEVVAMADSPDRDAWDHALGDVVAAHQPDLVVLAGFMKILSPAFLQRFPGQVINTHPGLLPAFPGAHAVRDALDARVPVTGASVIWVDEGIDTGQVIARAEVPVLAGDDEPSLHERIKVVERQMLVRVVAELVTPEHKSRGQEHRSGRQRAAPRGREHRPSASEGGADRPVRAAHEAEQWSGPTGALSARGRPSTGSTGVLP